jgi:outer membrane protein assembly factor BamB
MYRPLKRVIPFVNGKTVLFESYTCGGPAPESVIVAAAADGVGVLSVAKKDWLWKIEGGTPITACQVSCPASGQNEVITGGADGFIAAFSMNEGRPLRRFDMGAPVTALVYLPETGMLAVATRTGVLALDADWKSVATYPLEAARMCKLGDNTILVAALDGTLVNLSLH